MNDCRAFLFFLGARPLYRQKILSSKEIFCSPDAETNLVSTSRAIQTPTGSYDAREFFSQKKITQQPDILLVKADASARNLPSNLKAFKCPRVLLVGDTHHMGMPIQKLVAYAKQENFDRIILDHTRHHARWFFEAGLKNLHWIPAFDFTFFPRTPSPIPSRQFSFVGQAGKFHPYRCQVIEGLKKSGLPLEMLRGTPAEAADIYADSVVTLNVSLNGDLNLRVFEALAAGGFLLTDKLTPSSGLELLFKPGEDIEVWSSVDELMEKARFYLDHPEDADRIRRSGQQKLLELHHPDVKIREFFELVSEGKENPLYSLDEEASKVRASVQGADLVPGVEAYEFLQEMHRTTPPLVVWVAKEAIDEANAFFADLPRVVVNTAGGAILFVSGAEAELDEMLGFFEGKFVIAPHSVSAHLQEWGFVAVAKGVYEFAYGALRSLKLLDTVDAAKVKTALPEILDACTQAFQALKVADKALALELPEVYQNALQRALFLDRNSLPALFQLADLCLQAGVEEDAAILLHEAHRIQPLPPEINQLREDLEQKWVSSAGISEYKQAISGGTPPLPTTSYSILVVTNLFPPQEMGGYGRKIWEFSNGLIKRGHHLKILTGDAPYLQKAPDGGEPDLEPLVERSLVLQGEWKNGKTQQIGDLTFFRRTAQANKEKVLEAVTSFKPDFVLLGNFDFLGVDILRALIAIKMPVLHSLGNQTPGYHPQESIESPLYTIAPASDWLGRNLLEQGYKVSKLSTVYPGARVDRFFKQFLPDIRRLRIAFAGLVMPYKGAHVLMDALNILNQSGIEFEADFAGDSTDEGYIRTLKEFAQNNGMGAKVRFNGFLDRQGLAALFARCNVLVFPTQVPEAFGISQVEAMASGLIVITSGTGGTQEVIRHGIDGLVFEMGNAVSLAQNLAALATNKELRDKLQINSQKKAMQFSVTNSVVRIESIAEDLVSFKNGKNQQKSTGSDESCLMSTNATLQDAQVAFTEGRLSDAEDICREILGNDERCEGAWYLMGKMAMLQGDLETAGDFASVACELEPENAEFVRGLAEVFLRKKELEPAEQHARRALGLLPDSPEGLVLLARILAEKEEKSAAMDTFQEAVRIRKDYAEGHSHYALALQKFGRGKDAISQIRKACALEPDSVEFQTNLAILLEQNARYVDALAAYGKAARMNPNVGFVWFRQGKLLNGLKRYAEALSALEKAISLPGQLGDYHYECGLALHMTKRFQEALVHYEKALSMGYNTAALQCNRGVIYKDLRRGGDSILAFHTAVMMEPTNVSYLNNLGAAALEIGLNSEALECFEQAVEKNPKLPTAHNNIGNLLKDRARGMDALPHYIKSMELNPNDRDSPSNYLLCHMYIPDMDPKFVFEEHKKWGLSTTKKFPPAFKFKPRAVDAKIRLGFLSADLCHHPVAHFIEPIFREYDRERFEVVAYGDQRKSDDYSARFAKQVDLWRETSSYDDKALAKLIHDDHVDILFELAGHTAYNRLGVFALKPAPVQVTYLGYPGTTGLPAIDFRITDAFADPQGTTEHLHTEKLIRVPECAWCFQPSASTPEVEALPAIKNGYVTFGCFNNMAKLNPALFEAWAEILLGVPNSHLRLKARTLTDEGVRKELMAYFTDRGIDEHRLEFFGHTKETTQHLNHYHAVDIALDSYPYHGTTTTCEALWMGCPVVTRAGKVHVSRVGVSLLNTVGLQDFIAETRESYIEKAVNLAGDLDKLGDIRSNLRKKMQSSALLNSSRFVRGFEAALMEVLPKAQKPFNPIP